MSSIVLYCAITGAVNAVTSLVLGLYVVLTNPRSLANRTFFGFAMSVGLWSVCYTFWQTSEYGSAALIWIRWLMGGAVFIPTFFIHFVVTLLGLGPNRRGLIRWSYLLSTLLLLTDFTPLFVAGLVPRAGFPFWPVPGPFFHIFLVHFASCVIYAHYLMYREIRGTTGSRRNQVKYVALGTLLGFGGGATNFPLWYGISIPPVGNGLVALYVAMTAYSIVRYRLLDINVALARMALFVLLYIPLLLFPFVLGKMLEPSLAARMGPSWWMLPMIMEAAFATGGLVVYRAVRQKAEERLLAEQRRYQAVLRQASQNMTLIKELGKLLRRTVALLTKEVGLSHVAIYLWDQRAKKYVPKASRRWKIATPPTFGSQDALLRYFDFSHDPAVTEELQLQARSTGTTTDLHQVVASLRALRAAVVVPSFVERRCIGFLVLGEKKFGALYTPDDLAVFQVLANQAALAVENAIFYEELKRTQADLFQTAKMADLGRMAGGMSHQINNRFHVLTMLAGTMMSDMKGRDLGTLSQEEIQRWWDKVLETFKKVEDNSLQGGDIVKTLLKFSRPSGEYKPVTWPKIAATALEVVQHRVDLTRFDLKEQFPDGLPPVNGDHNLLADCLFNLISNAYDAMEHKAQLLAKGELPVHPEDPSPYRGRLVLRGRQGRSEEKDWVVFEVADNGVGMTPEEAECLFFPFFTTKGTAEKGTGLGLYVIQRVIERHGGTISCQSEYGVGTTFTIRLPAWVGGPEPAAAPQGKPHA